MSEQLKGNMYELTPMMEKIREVQNGLEAILEKRYFISLKKLQLRKSFFIEWHKVVDEIDKTDSKLAKLTSVFKLIRLIKELGTCKLLSYIEYKLYVSKLQGAVTRCFEESRENLGIKITENKSSEYPFKF